MKALRKAAIEFLTIGVLGIAVAFSANAFRAKGHIKVSKNYFDTGEALVNAQRNGASRFDGSIETPPAPALKPAGTIGASKDDRAPDAPPEPKQAGTNGTSSVVATQPSNDAEERHIKHPYQEIDFEGVMAVLKDPNTASGLNVIVDARKDDTFEEGHIPGAILCNPHEIDLYMDTLRPAVSGADKVIVYCGGGDCEDSVAMCRELLEMNVPFEALQLYAGGWKDWTSRRGPADSGKN